MTDFVVFKFDSEIFLISHITAAQYISQPVQSAQKHYRTEAIRISSVNNKLK